MKKTLIIAGIAALTFMLSSSMSYANANTDTTTPKKPACKCSKPMPPKMKRPNFDERLKLTEDQKAQAHQIRMKGHEKIKPVMDKMKAKHDEIRQVAQSNLSQAEKDKKMLALKEDMRKLKKEARQIRMENTKEFEAILTDEQKTEFEKIKQEGRKKHNKHMKKFKGHGPEGHPNCPAQAPTK